MPQKNKALVVVMLLLALGFGSIGCSAQLSHESKSNIVTAQDGGKEEILSVDDDDEFPPRRDSKPETVAGEILMVIGYVGYVIGSALLPLLLL